MRFLVDFQNSIGGAPRSQLAHSRALIELGHEIVAVISPESSPHFLTELDCKIFYLSQFETSKIVNNIKLLKRYLRIIEEEDIEVLYVNRVDQCQFLSIVADLAGVKIINARAGGLLQSDLVKVHKDKPYILYSQENLKAFLDAGFNRDQLVVIPNRLENKSITLDVPVPQKELVVTITSNIKKDTLTGLMWFFNFIRESSNENHLNIRINLSGEDILRDRESSSFFFAKLEETIESLPENYSMKYLGWVDNVSNVQNSSHICIGKGRSVIQPAMAGKICFVISESGNILRCKTDIYEELRYFNFSGRGKISETKDSKHELLALFSGKNYMEYKTESERLKERFINDYSFSHLAKKVQALLQSRMFIEQQSKRIKGVYKFFYLYRLVLTRKLFSK